MNLNAKRHHCFLAIMWSRWPTNSPKMFSNKILIDALWTISCGKKRLEWFSTKEFPGMTQNIDFIHTYRPPKKHRCFFGGLVLSWSRDCTWNARQELNFDVGFAAWSRIPSRLNSCVLLSHHRVSLAPRQNLPRIILKGIFQGVKVVRGPDWDWGNQDGECTRLWCVCACVCLRGG